MLTLTVEKIEQCIQRAHNLFINDKEVLSKVVPLLQALKQLIDIVGIERQNSDAHHEMGTFFLEKLNNLSINGDKKKNIIKECLYYFYDNDPKPTYESWLAGLGMARSKSTIVLNLSQWNSLEKYWVDFPAYKNIENIINKRETGRNILEKLRGDYSENSEADGNIFSYFLKKEIIKSDAFFKLFLFLLKNTNVNDEYEAKLDFVMLKPGLVSKKLNIFDDFILFNPGLFLERLAENCSENNKKSVINYYYKHCFAKETEFTKRLELLRALYLDSNYYSNDITNVSINYKNYAIIELFDKINEGLYATSDIDLKDALALASFFDNRWHIRDGEKISYLPSRNFQVIINAIEGKRIQICENDLDECKKAFEKKGRFQQFFLLTQIPQKLIWQRVDLKKWAAFIFDCFEMLIGVSNEKLFFQVFNDSVRLIPPFVWQVLDQPSKKSIFFKFFYMPSLTHVKENDFFEILNTLVNGLSLYEISFEEISSVLSTPDLELRKKYFEFLAFGNIYRINFKNKDELSATWSSVISLNLYSNLNQGGVVLYNNPLKALSLFRETYFNGFLGFTIKATLAPLEKKEAMLDCIKQYVTYVNEFVKKINGKRSVLHQRLAVDFTPKIDFFEYVQQIFEKELLRLSVVEEIETLVNMLTIDSLTLHDKNAILDCMQIKFNELIEDSGPDCELEEECEPDLNKDVVNSAFLIICEFAASRLDKLYEIFNKNAEFIKKIAFGLSINQYAELFTRVSGDDNRILLLQQYFKESLFSKLQHIQLADMQGWHMLFSAFKSSTQRKAVYELFEEQKRGFFKEMFIQGIVASDPSVQNFALALYSHLGQFDSQFVCDEKVKLSINHYLLSEDLNTFNRDRFISLLQQVRGRGLDSVCSDFQNHIANFFKGLKSDVGMQNGEIFSWKNGLVEALNEIAQNPQAQCALLRCLKGELKNYFVAQDLKNVDLSQFKGVFECLSSNTARLYFIHCLKDMGYTLELSNTNTSATIQSSFVENIGSTVLKLFSRKTVTPSTLIPQENFNKPGFESQTSNTHSIKKEGVEVSYGVTLNDKNNSTAPSQASLENFASHSSFSNQLNKKNTALPAEAKKLLTFEEAVQRNKSSVFQLNLSSNQNHAFAMVAAVALSRLVTAIGERTQGNEGELIQKCATGLFGKGEDATATPSVILTYLQDNCLYQLKSGSPAHRAVNRLMNDLALLYVDGSNIVVNFCGNARPRNNNNNNNQEQRSVQNFSFLSNNNNNNGNTGTRPGLTRRGNG